jgi:hypothetical protein
MPRRCTVCDHPKRSDVDRALVTRTGPMRGIARKFGMSEDALYRHAWEHLPQTLARGVERKEAARGADLLARLSEVHEDTRAIFREARETQQAGLALQAVARLEKQLELEARLLGELKDAGTTTVNLLVTSEWRAAQSALLEALAPYPAARVRAAQALATLAGGQPNGNGAGKHLEVVP